MTKENDRTIYGPDGRPIDLKSEECSERHVSGAAESAASIEDEKNRLELEALRRALRPWYKRPLAIIAAVGAILTVATLSLQVLIQRADLQVAMKQLAEVRQARDRARAESDSLGMEVLLQKAEYDSLTMRVSAVHVQLGRLGTNVESIQLAVTELPESSSRQKLVQALVAAGIEISAIQTGLPAPGSVSWAFQVLTTSPARQSTHLSPDTEIRFLFSHPLDPASVDHDQVQVVAQGEPILFRTSLVMGGRLLLVQPDRPLPEGKVTVRLGPDIRNTNGKLLDTEERGVPTGEPFILSFVVAGRE